MRIDLKTIFVLILLGAMLSLAVRDYLDQLPLRYAPYTPSLLSSTLSDGQCVMVSFYADWDIDTQHSLRYLSHDVTRSLRRHNMLALEADWTNNSPEVSQLMSELNLNSVPALGFFDPSKPKPVLILDIPSEEAVLAAIEGCCR